MLKNILIESQILFVPFVLIGSLSQCSKAADQLTKKQVNPEIESDYERSTDENVSKQCTGKISYLFI